MKSIYTSRLELKPITRDDFKTFVEEMLVDPRVVQYYYSYQDLNSIETIYSKAEVDFWEYFKKSKLIKGLGTWSARQINNDVFVGWGGLLQTELTSKYGGPEIQYMIGGNYHGKGYATEIASNIMNYAIKEGVLDCVIATVDIPNIGSIKVLEKLDFENKGKIDAYGSSEMYLFSKKLK